MEERIAKAVSLFKSGYNCAQSVAAAFADMYGFAYEGMATDKSEAKTLREKLESTKQ